MTYVTECACNTNGYLQAEWIDFWCNDYDSSAEINICTSKDKWCRGHLSLEWGIESRQAYSIYICIYIYIYIYTSHYLQVCPSWCVFFRNRPINVQRHDSAFYYCHNTLCVWNMVISNMILSAKFSLWCNHPCMRQLHRWFICTDVA